MGKEPVGGESRPGAWRIADAAAAKGRQTRVRSAARRKTFLTELRRSANVSQAAGASGASKSALYLWRHKMPKFRAAWDEALEAALDDLEAALRRRAVDGVEQPVFYAGKPCGTVTRYSDQLGMFLLRHRRPQAFGGGGGEAALQTAEDAKARLAAKLAGMGEGPDGV